MKQFFSELWERLWTKEPDFFKKLRNIGLYLTGVAATLLALQSDLMHLITLPPIIATIAKYLTAIGSALALFSKLPNAAQPTPTDNQ